MPFRFQLQGLLRYRESLERREEHRLRALHHEAAFVRQNIARLDAIETEAYSTRNGCMQELELRGSELQFSLTCSNERKQVRASWQVQLLEVETQALEQQKKLVIARQGQRVVERLRDLKLLAYRQEEARREQKRLDEVFQQRHLRDSDG